MLSFILSPVGKWIGGALGVLIAIAAIFGAGASWGWSKKAKLCEAANARAQIAALQRDLDNANETAAEALAHSVELQAQSNKNQEVIRDLRNQLAKRPADKRCAATDDDARRLRNLR